MTYSEACKILESGGFIALKSWKGDFLWLKPGVMVKSDWCKDPVLKMIADGCGGEVAAEPVLCKFDNQNRKVISGIELSTSELSSTNWIEVKVETDSDGLAIKVPTKHDDMYVEGNLFDSIDIIKRP